VIYRLHNRVMGKWIWRDAHFSDKTGGSSAASGSHTAVIVFRSNAAKGSKLKFADKRARHKTPLPSAITPTRLT